MPRGGEELHPCGVPKLGKGASARSFALKVVLQRLGIAMEFIARGLPQDSYCQHLGIEVESEMYNFMELGGIKIC